MLSLQIKANESIFIFDDKGSDVGIIKLIDIDRYKVKLGFDLDKKYIILREKVLSEKLSRMRVEMDPKDLLTFLKKEKSKKSESELKEGVCYEDL